MRVVKLFKIKNDLKRVNIFLSKIQLIHDNNRVMNVQVSGNFVYVTASVEIDLFSQQLDKGEI